MIQWISNHQIMKTQESNLDVIIWCQCIEIRLLDLDFKNKKNFFWSLIM